MNKKRKNFIKNFGLALNTCILILSISTIFPDIATNNSIKNILCYIIIAMQVVSILAGNIYQSLIDNDHFKEGKKKFIKDITPYAHDSVLGAREEMRQGLTALTSVFIICCIYWAFMTRDALKFVMVICIIAIAFIYADYITHNDFYTKKYDEKLKNGEDLPNSARGLARIYRHEYNCLGFKRFINRVQYKELSNYKESKPGLQDECIKCILFSKVDAIKNPEIYYSALIMFFNIILVIPNAVDVAIENILPFNADITQKVLPYILIVMNVTFTIIGVVSVLNYNNKCEFIKTLGNVISGIDCKKRHDLYLEIKNDYDFKLMRARGIFMFNSLAIDEGLDLDTFFERRATPEDKNEEPFVDDDGNTYTGYLKYRMLYVHKFITNLQRFFHTVILSYIALLCLLLDIKIELMTIGIIFAIVTVAVLIFGIFILPNIGRWRISKYCKQLNKDNK